MTNFRKAGAGLQIFLLVSMSFALAFVIGDSVGIVSGQSFGLDPATIAKTAAGPSATNTPSSFFGVGRGTEAAAAEVTTTTTAETAATTETTVASTEVTGGLGSGGGIQSVFSGTIFGSQAGGAGAGALWGGALVSGLVWGGIAAGVGLLVAKLLGLNDDQAKSIALSAFGGVFTGSTIYFLGANGAVSSLAGGTGAILGIVGGIGVGAAIFIATYKKQKKELVRFECLPWEAPLGGSRCEECNGDPLRPCSEYRCKSLGQACEIVNSGTDNELCVWVGKGDTQSPSITPWEEVLGPGELRYIPDTERPPGLGSKIVRPVGQGCLQAYTALQFGVTTDEPSQCRIDYSLTEKYDDMNFLFGESNIYAYNHTQILKVPSPFTQEGDAVPEIHNDGTYTLWTRCRDANGNENVDAYTFRFCVDPSPDTEAPRVEGTSIRDGSPVQFNVDEVPIELYVNEPAECKWSREDKAYEAMENRMNCHTESFRVNADLNYVCTSTLTNVENRQDNEYYFRCLDFSTAPGGRNVMTTSHMLTLRGTEELTITEAGPGGVIEGATSIIEVLLSVETSHGADEGNSICYFSNTPGDSNSFIAMDTDFVYEHNQSIFLAGGDYTYTYRCIDAGGNTAETSVDFRVEVDTVNPLVSRALRDNDNLKIITTEDAQCVYSPSNCNFAFDEGEPLTYENPTVRNVHVGAWDEDITYHVKCQDLQGNRPVPNSCSIIVQGADL